MNLDTLFRPRGVAVCGSTSPGKLGEVLIHRLVNGGYEKVFAINPKSQGCAGVKGYAHIGEVGEPIDLAVIAAPANTVPSVLQEAGEAGVRGAIVITSGFSEAHNYELEEEVKAVAKKYGIRFIGPNCSGLVNTHFSLFPTLEESPKKGGLALVSQSGAVGGLIMAMSLQQNVGISKFVSFGNGADLNELELLRFLKDDDETKVIAVYAENIRKGREFMEVVSEITKVKPVVIIKSGRTSSGQRAALSHTGSLASADKVYDAAITKSGAIRANSVEDMLDICKGLSLLPPAQGDRLAIITNSGGPGVMSADATEGSGLTLPEPSEQTKDKLREFLPGYAGFANPIDVTVEGTAEQYEKSTKVMLQDDYDLALIIDIGTPYLKASPIAQGALNAAQASGKPVACNFEVGEDIPEAKALLDEHGAPAFSSAERAVRALAKAAEYARLKKAEHYTPQTFAEKRLEIEAGRNALLEYESMELLGSEGVSVPEHRFVARREELVQAAHEIGYPLVLKVVSPQILHKSDFGGVKLNIGSDEQVLAAFDEIAAMAADKDFRGVLLYPMLGKAAEMIVGFSRDAQFGPVVICGMGGIYTEILKDISLRIAPVSKEDALEMLHELKTWPLLAGARGQAPADVDGLAELIHKFSQLPFIYPQLKEGELNPVFVYQDRVEAADARIILTEE